jgi:hypothetical protein
MAVARPPPDHCCTDIELNPSRAGGGFWYSHIDWMLVKHCRKPRVADVSDLPKNEALDTPIYLLLPVPTAPSFCSPGHYNSCHNLFNQLITTFGTSPTVGPQAITMCFATSDLERAASAALGLTSSIWTIFPSS